MLLTHPIIIIDDDEAIVLSMDTTLRLAGFENILTCQDSRRAIDLIAEHNAEVIFLDLTMPHVSGQELLAILKEDYPDIPVIVFTGTVDIETAVQCIKMGAFDYIVKPVGADRLITNVNRAMAFRDLKRENRALKKHILTEKLENPELFSGIVTNNSKMLSIFKYMESIAKTFQGVLITGETGVGKELVAKTIHTLSGLSGSFITVNVAGLDDNVFSDTLFGHVKGAFTGAEKHRKGLVEQAAGGTLQLDEIAELSVSSQVKLLRLLQESEYRTLGKDEIKKASARIIASTNEDLHQLRISGKFRKDLLYRLQTHHIHLPPLKDRIDDIPLLLEHFLNKAAASFNIKKPSYPKELIDLLQTFSFPGNIRELQAMVFDAVSRHTSKTLSMSAFKEYIDKHKNVKAIDVAVEKPATIVFPATLPTIEEATQELIKEAIHRSKGNQSLAARLLGISQQAVNQRLKKNKRTADHS